MNIKIIKNRNDKSAISLSGESELSFPIVVDLNDGASEDSIIREHANIQEYTCLMIVYGNKSNGYRTKNKRKDLKFMRDPFSDSIHNV